MPKFLQDAISQAIEKVLQDCHKPSEGADEAISDAAGGGIQSAVDDIAKQIVDSVRRVSDIIGEISAAAREQSEGIASVNENDTRPSHVSAKRVGNLPASTWCFTSSVSSGWRT